jgi:hypothetical protein
MTLKEADIIKGGVSTQVKKLVTDDTRKRNIERCGRVILKLRLT